MSKERSPWQDGKRAWERLKGWLTDDAERSDDSSDALKALCDVGRVRRLLDQAELVAVRSARQHGKSWAEIATQLGVSRQSAWERWRDIDAAVPERAAVIERAAAEVRRRGTVRVPNVVGMSVGDAGDALNARGLRAIGADPDDQTLPVVDVAGWLVTDQSPESGAKVPAGSRVALWIERRDGGSGVREPRRPQPDPLVGRAMRDEFSDEAVG